MSEGDAQALRHSEYALLSANDIDAERLVNFASRVWHDRPPYDRILSSWWRRASSDCAFALVHQPTRAMVGLCAGRPSEWIIGGQSHPAVSICDFFIDPHHGGKLLGRRLLRTFEAPGWFVNAISISDVAAAYVRRMGWRGPYASSLMVMPLPLATLHNAGAALLVICAVTLLRVLRPARAIGMVPLSHGYRTR